MTELNQLIWGMLGMACWIAGMFFLRYWRLSRDRLFLFFCLGFWSFAVHWVGLGIAAPGVETRHYFYLVRLLAFVFILIGIIDKNHRSRRE